ncbi:unnamed protein product [Peronospora belbahrii]|uniref:Uncharacterized protein n=1 Tax=Peronospora belbahrii TaxID=622444 RepID=A0ABN8CNH3_9STRA|nr:unnamed protein product [Peronospora belbahrii]
MTSFLLGDEYASSSSSSDNETSSSLMLNTNAYPSISTASIPTQSLPSADELFSSDTSTVLNTGVLSATPAPMKKRKNDQVSRPATKVAKLETRKAVRKSTTVPFTPPQLRRPNISTEDSSLWNTNRTLVLQKKVKETDTKK